MSLLDEKYVVIWEGTTTVVSGPHETEEEAKSSYRFDTGLTIKKMTLLEYYVLSGVKLLHNVMYVKYRKIDKWDLIDIESKEEWNELVPEDFMVDLEGDDDGETIINILRKIELTDEEMALAVEIKERKVIAELERRIRHDKQDLAFLENELNELRNSRKTVV